MKFDLDTLIKILGKAQPENSFGEVKLQQSYLYQNVFLPSLSWNSEMRQAARERTLAKSRKEKKEHETKGYNH